MLLARKNITRIKKRRFTPRSSPRLERKPLCWARRSNRNFERGGRSLKRRDAIRLAGMIPFIPRIALAAPFRRARPGDAEWPSPVRWRDLGRSLGGRLAPGASPLTVCASDRTGKACHDALMGLRNPYYIGDQPGLTQIAGWTHAWSSSPSAYVASVRTAADVARCVNFARENRLRLVVKGGGHSYQGTSSSADSLLVWTRAMNRVGLRDESVTVGPGAVWMNVYDAVT